MTTSPFPYQGPLEPDQMQGRDELVAELVERVSTRRVTALVGPRRFGKTTALRKVQAICAAGGATVVWIDTYGVLSTADLVVRIDTALADAEGPARSAFEHVAMSVSLHLGVLQAQFARKPSERPDPDAALHLLLDTLVRGARTAPTVIVIDEFASIVNVAGAAETLRTKLQHDVQQIGLLFAGSQPSTMTALFADPGMPWYNQADVITIEPLSIADVSSIIDAGFTSTDRDPGGLARSIYHFADGHPHRTMQLADAAWRAADTGAEYTDEVWATALDSVRTAVAGQQEVFFAALGNASRAVLRALAHERPLFGASLDLYGVSSSSVRNARRELLANGTIADRDGSPFIVDPLLADWIRHRLPL